MGEVLVRSAAQGFKGGLHVATAGTGPGCRVDARVPVDLGYTPTWRQAERPDRVNLGPEYELLDAYVRGS